MVWLMLCLIFQLVHVSFCGSPNILLVLTDDQDKLLDSLKAVPKTIELIANNGAFLENAFVNSPICCPSRSSILTGKYAHNINVVNNSISGNCSSPDWQENFEGSSIASLLKTFKNYTTFYAGKYLNQYGSKEAGGVEHVPAGYDWWLGLKGNSRYYNYTLSLNGTGKYFQNEYLTDLMAQYSVDFIRLNYKKPFFMMIAPPACHAPFTPADRHMDKFISEKAVRNPSFNYSSSKKHWIVGMPPKSLPSNVSRLDIIQRKRLQTLLAVDEMVERIVLELKKLGVYERTYLIFSSDNGYHIGQFGQPWDKRQPYETDIRVPFMSSGPGIPKKVKISYPISSVDLAPTILDLAGISPQNNMDGQSFKKKLFEQNGFNKTILVEYWGEGAQKSNDEDCFPSNDQLAECRVDSWCKCQDSKNNTYSCVLSLSEHQYFKFCHFIDHMNFIEAYDITNDNYELNNIYGNLQQSDVKLYSTLLQVLETCKGKGCNELNF